MIWIGKISYQAVAAVTIFINIFWVVEVLNEIVGMGSVSLLSQSHGSKNYRRTQRVAEQTLTFKFTIACAASFLLLIILRPLIAAFSGDAAVQDYALSYGYVRGAFIPLFFTSYSINTIFRNTGNAKFPMYLMGGAGILNIILDPVLMFDTVPLFTPLAALGVFVFQAPVTFIWMTLIIAEIAEAAVMYIEYRKGLWQYKRV